jgi:hypothetical protein
LLYQTALREVIGRCLYGVDVNPMSAELCRVNLWLEALEPGKPLSFLDHHIRVGNSLLGATPELIAAGIPDDVFKPITGDDPRFCREYKKQNQKERKSRTSDMFGHEPVPWERMGNLATAMAELEALDDDTVAGIQAKQVRYAELVQEAGYLHGQLLADAWCAAFVWKKCKEPNRPYPILDDLLRKIEQNPFQCPPWMREEIGRLARQYQFFHWHLAFPEVFTPRPVGEGTGVRAGFDVVLGNPPWEHTELKEKEWFTERSPEIASAATGAKRKAMIQKLQIEAPELWAEFAEVSRHHEGQSHFLGDSGRYPFCGRGRINLYAVFAEGMRNQLNATGRMGCVLPSGIATDDMTKFFFQDIVDKKSLVSLFSFENEEFIFPDIHHATRFCLITIGSGDYLTAESADFVFFARQVEHIKNLERRFTLSHEDINLLNPNTRTCPIFRSKRDAELTKAIYQRVPVLIKEGPPEINLWGIKFKQGLFNMTSDSHLFRTREQLEAEDWRLMGNVFERDGEKYLPLYEAKMIHHFDHRWGTYDGQTEAQANQGKLPELDEAMHADPSLLALPRYWIKKIEVDKQIRHLWSREWLISFRDITGATVFRTVIAAVIPKVGVGHTCPIVLPGCDAVEAALFVALLCTFANDFVARQKIGGTHLTYGYFNQLPVLPPTTYAQPCPWSSGQTLRDWILPRVLELTYTAWDLEPFAQDCGFKDPPFRWDEARRFLLRCELDAAFFHLYGIDRDDVAYIMDTFPIVKRKDEAAHGCYRTKDTILEMYDAMISGQPYQTRLEPPAADLRCCHPPR